MRDEPYCEACGREDLALVEAFAGEDSSGDVEVLVWSCPGCGGRIETVRPLGAEVEEPGRARRVA